MTSASASRVTRSSRSLRLAIVLFAGVLAAATVLRAQETPPPAPAWGIGAATAWTSSGVFSIIRDTGPRVTVHRSMYAASITTGRSRFLSVTRSETMYPRLAAESIIITTAGIFRYP